ncbi:tripartite tricarboxylate transporter TctB family protein [Vreelandella nanhaiensis]|nr:tripartite tricarboxylate transporter TctB family protein [Halomonas nanhaiensis]
MRLFFYAFMLLAAIVYTYMAFFDLSFLTNRGRMGPGFFPRFIGGFLVLCLVAAIIKEARLGKLLEKEPDGQMRDAAVLIGLAMTFGVLLVVTGYLIATPLFVGAALLYFNSKHLLMNGAITLAAPLTIYVLFGQVLNASLPHGLWW